MPYWKVAKKQVYFEERGQGEPILLLKGLGRSAAYWLGFEDKLACDFRVITLDWPGLGRSKGGVQWGLSVHDLAELSAELLVQRRAEGAHVLGLSLGGMVALAMACRFGELIRSVTAINTSARMCKTGRISSKAASRLFLGGLFKPILEPLVAPVIVTPNFIRANPKIIGQLETLTKNHASFLTAIKQLMAAARFGSEEDLARIAIPTLLIAGLKDEFVHPHCSRKIHEVIKGSRYEEIADGPHELTLEKGDEVVSIVKEFVLSLSKKKT